MSAGIIALLVCAAIGTFVIFYKLGKNSAVQERIAENTLIKEKNKQMEQECVERESRLKQLCALCIQRETEFQQAVEESKRQHNELINKLLVQYKNTEADYALRAAEMSHNLDSIKDERFSKINEAATRLREKLYDDLKAEIALAAEQYEQKQNEQAKIILGINEEINELKASRDALIQANMREEELRLQQDFYKIKLKSQDFSDIKLLKSIEQHLYNKDPLYKLIWTQFYMTPAKEMLNRIIGKEKTSGIYKITNQLNGKVYIGQSVDLHTRLTNHIKAAIGIGTIAHQLVHDAMNIDGIENFTFEIVEKCEKEYLNKKEKLWIETYASDKYGYNRTAGGSKEE